MEDETALSIIDPVTVNIEIGLDKGLQTLKVFACLDGTVFISWNQIKIHSTPD